MLKKEHIEFSGELNNKTFISELIESILLTLSCFVSLYTIGINFLSLGYASEGGLGFIFICSFIPTSVFIIIFKSNLFIKWILTSLILVLFLLYTFINSEIIVIGLNNFLRLFSSKINTYYIFNLPYIYPIGEYADQNISQLYFLFFIFCFTSFVLVISFIQKNNWLIVIFIFFVNTFVSCSLFDEIQVSLMSLNIFSLVLNIAFLSTRTHFKRRETVAYINYRTKKNKRMGQSKNTFLNYSALIILTLFISITTFLISPPDTMDRELRNNMRSSADDLIEAVVNFDFNSIFPSISTSGVNGGDLDFSGDRVITNETHLVIEADYIIPMLLKGYSGSVYTSDRWEFLTADKYDELDVILEELAEHTIIPQTFTGYFYKGVYAEFTEIDLSIENLKANSTYLYTPYTNTIDQFTSNSLNSDDFIHDLYISGKNTPSKYNLSSLVYLNTDYHSTTAIDILPGDAIFNQVSPNYETYRDAFSVSNISYLLSKAHLYPAQDALLRYEDFVYENYTQVPDGLERLKLDVQSMSINDPIYSVKSFLHRNAIYDYSPGSTPDGKDFIEYFIYENHRGFCTHFATSATIMFRMMGIPARYVEGYTLTASDIKQSETNPNGMSAEIPDRNAHAWVEIWLGPYGWIPVEVTPGFSGFQIADPVFNPDLPQNLASPTPSPTPSPSPTPDSSATPAPTNTPSPSPSPENSLSPNRTPTPTNGSNNGDFTQILMVLFWIIIAISLIIITWFFQHKIRLNMMKKSVKQMYKHAIFLLKFIGYTAAFNESELEFSKRVAIEDFSILTIKALEIKFSNDIHEEKELKKAYSSLSEIDNQVKNTLDTKKLIIYKLLSMNLNKF